MKLRHSLPFLTRWTGDAALAAVGNVSAAAAHAAMVVLLAKLVSPATLGLYALGLAIAMPVALLTRCQLRGLLAADVTDSFALSTYVRLRLLSSVMTVIVCAAIGWALTNDRQATCVIVWIAALRGVEGVSDLFYGFLQRRDRWPAIALSQLIRGIATVALTAAILLSSGGLTTALAGAFAASLVVLLVFDLPVMRVAAGDQPLWSPEALQAGRSLALFALPMGFVGALISLNTQIPRYAIEFWRGPHELGYYAALGQLVAIGNLGVQAFGQAAVARLAAAWRQSRPNFYRLLWLMLAGAATAALLSTAAAALWGRQLLELLFQPEYGANAEALVWLAAATGLSYLSSVLGYAMTAARKITVQLPISLASAAACALLSAWLIPAHGLIGAAGAVAGAWAISTAAGGWILWRAAEGVALSRAAAAPQVALRPQDS